MCLNLHYIGEQNTLIQNSHCKMPSLYSKQFYYVSIYHIVTIFSIYTILLSSSLKHWRRQKTLPKHVCKEAKSCRLCVKNINKSANQSSIWNIIININTVLITLSYTYTLHLRLLRRISRYGGGPACSVTLKHDKKNVIFVIRG